MLLELLLEYDRAFDKRRESTSSENVLSRFLLLCLDAPSPQIEMDCRECLQESACLCDNLDEQGEKQIGEGEGPVNDIQSTGLIETLRLDKGIPESAEVGRIVAEQLQASVVDHTERDCRCVGAIDGTIKADPEGEAEYSQRQKIDGK
jgi:hypothetical protein